MQLGRSKIWLTLGSSQGGNVSGLGADIVDNGSLEPRDDKVGSFVVDLLLDAENTGVLDSTVTTVDYTWEFQVERSDIVLWVSFPGCLWIHVNRPVSMNIHSTALLFFFPSWRRL